MNSDQNYKLFELFNAIREGTISAEQCLELDEILSKDKRACKYYLEYFNMCAIFKMGKALEKELELTVTPEELCKMDVWMQLAQYEKTAPVLQIEKPEILREPVKTLKIEKVPRKVDKFSLYALIVSMAAILIIMFSVFLESVHSPVAVLTNTVNAEWSDTEDIPVNGDMLRRGRLTLARGFAEITFDDGAVVVVESPAVIDLESPGSMFLANGKISAVVSESATGFTVNTLFASIVDFGTEFGVAVGKDGSVCTQVFSGKVKLSSELHSEIEKETLWLTEDHAASVDNQGRLSRQYAIQHNRVFVRSIEAAENQYRYLGVNLIQNPGFEKDAVDVNVDGSGGVRNVAIRDWKDNVAATVVNYDASIKEFPQLERDPVPNNCGRNFFVGVDDNEIYQDIPVEQLGSLIDRNAVSFKFSGWFGGFGGHRDTLLMAASFRNERGEEISQISIGNVSPEERNNKTMFVYKQTNGEVPVGTDHIRIFLKSKRYSGSMGDSYADNLEMILTER